MLLGALVVVSMAVSFGFWWEIRLFTPALLLLLLSLKYHPEDDSLNRT